MVSSALPDTMRASVLRAPREVVVEERPLPLPGAGEVLVHIGSVGICGSDVHYYREGRIGEYVVREPLVLGHEAGGRVVAVGEGVPAARVGQRVSLEPGVPCRRCRECRAGRYNLCREVRFFATPPVDGALCEYVAHDAEFAWPVPDAVSDDAAGLLEPLSVGLWACRKAEIAPGSRLLVAGAGPIGLVIMQVARAAGAAEVVVTDVEPARLEAAKRFGATSVLPADAPLAELDADAFIDASGAPAAVAAGLPAVRPAGSVVLVGMGADKIALPVPLVQGRELRVTGTFRYAGTWPAAVALAASRDVDLDGLVTGRFDLENVVDALEHGGTPGAIKAVVRP